MFSPPLPSLSKFFSPPHSPNFMFLFSLFGINKIQKQAKILSSTKMIKQLKNNSIKDSETEQDEVKCP